ncbi:MAG: urea transporter [Synechococcales cyanobacterium H12SWP_bin.12]|nr:urea transporter [Synechococcales cyanobacterium H12SWP_bin.12]
MQADVPSVYKLLQSLLPPPPPVKQQSLFTEQHFWAGPWGSGLRSFSQVIFINHPLSGGLLLLAFLIQSPWMALLAVIGMTTANSISRSLNLGQNLRNQGIHGFNGALVGCAAAVLSDFSSLFDAGLIAVLVALGGGLTTVMIELWRQRFHRRGDPPALTLPFCLITWGLVALVSPQMPDSIETVKAAASPSSVQALTLGLPHSFGQVFLCSDLASGWLVLLAVAVASPIAAALGACGALIGMITAMAIGADPAAIAQGLWGYNGTLVAIALGGIFHAPGRRAMAIALIGAGLASLLQALQGRWMGNLPPLTLSFVVTTWLLQRLAGGALPALIPVALHAVVTPEEHRKRFLVARELLGSFRRNLRQRVDGMAPNTGGEQPQSEGNSEMQDLFEHLDLNRNGHLSLEELRNALLSGGTSKQSHQRRTSSLNDQLTAAMASMDLNGDGRIDCGEFSQLIQRLQRLRQGEERLLLYLMPVDANGNDRLDQEELTRLLQSIRQPPLTAVEQALVFPNQQKSISWHDFVDRLLLS